MVNLEGINKEFSMKTKQGFFSGKRFFPIGFAAMFLAAVFSITFTACDDGSDSGDDTSGVYVAGICYSGDITGTFTATACYWKDGVRTDLPHPGNIGVCSGIIVSGGSVYVSGYYGDITADTGTGCYWKDGVRTDLPAPSNASKGSAITISGGSVYVAGVYYTDTGVSQACYWRDGVRTDLTAPSNDSEATGITISGGSVYISGIYRTDTGGMQACYWRDGVRIDLNPPPTYEYAVSELITTSSATSGIAVSGGSVYVSGMHQNFSFGAGSSTSITTACYWRDGVRTDLPAPSNAEGLDIAVSSGSVYVAGSYGTGNNRTACYWRDGVRTDLTNPGNSSFCSAITVSGGSVYVAGAYSMNANSATGCYWKDGVRTDLQETNSCAYAVFVTE
jgi:hypothetical protein